MRASRVVVRPSKPRGGTFMSRQCSTAFSQMDSCRESAYFGVRFLLRISSSVARLHSVSHARTTASWVAAASGTRSSNKGEQGRGGQPATRFESDSVGGFIVISGFERRLPSPVPHVGRSAFCKHGTLLRPQPRRQHLHHLLTSASARKTDS